MSRKIRRTGPRRRVERGWSADCPQPSTRLVTIARVADGWGLAVVVDPVSRVTRNDPTRMIAIRSTIEISRYSPSRPPDRRRRAIGSAGRGRRRAPHEWQKLRLVGLARPQAGQAIVGSGGAAGVEAVAPVSAVPAPGTSSGPGGTLRWDGPGRTGATSGGSAATGWTAAGWGSGDPPAGTGAASGGDAGPGAGASSGPPGATCSPDHSRKAPHEPQKVSPASFSWPHFEQMTLPAMDLRSWRRSAIRPVLDANLALE